MPGRGRRGDERPSREAGATHGTDAHGREAIPGNGSKQRLTNASV
jgi:hypothetical protein